MNDNNEEAGDQMLKLIRRARDAARADQWGVARELMRQARTLARTQEPVCITHCFAADQRGGVLCPDGTCDIQERRT